VAAQTHTGPPVERPRGVADELLWDVSYLLEQQHRGQFTNDGALVCCGQEFPCPSARLAARGLLCAQRLYPPATSRGLRVWRRWRVVLLVGRPRPSGGA
jgi:hypothetical protein